MNNLALESKLYKGDNKFSTKSAMATLHLLEGTHGVCFLDSYYLGSSGYAPPEIKVI